MYNNNNSYYNKHNSLADNSSEAESVESHISRAARGEVRWHIPIWGSSTVEGRSGDIASCSYWQTQISSDQTPSSLLSAPYQNVGSG